MVRVALSLGSNLGDRRAHLAWAVQQLSTILANLQISGVIETEPQDVPDPQPPYLNMAVAGETTLAPDRLMATLLVIERRGGRERHAPKAPRTLDLDLIFYGDRIIETPELTVPHPRFRDRRFVLEPLASIAPDWIDPMTGRTVKELLETLREKESGA